MKWNKVIGWLCAFTAVICLMVVPAHAGIIITEGKVASDIRLNVMTTDSGSK